MHSKIGNLVLNSQCCIAMPIGVYAGMEIIGATVKEVVTDPKKQMDAITALHARFHTQMMLTAMDLSAEAELFGCQIRMSDDEIPTVVGRALTSEKLIDALPLPVAGNGRTAVHLQTAQKLVALETGVPVLGGLIGPFSLASRLYGVRETLELSVTNPGLLETLLEKVTEFLIHYVTAFRNLGADGVIMAEPSAGLLSPRGLGRFSSMYVKKIVEATQSQQFTLVLHNCGAKIIHLPSLLEAGAEIYHFGAQMDMAMALEKVDNQVILSGNLDPVRVFYDGNPAQVAAETQNLLKSTSGFRNFILSSGCDIPPGAPIENLDAFYAAASEFHEDRLL